MTVGVGKGGQEWRTWGAVVLGCYPLLPSSMPEPRSLTVTFFPPDSKFFPPPPLPPLLMRKVAYKGLSSAYNIANTEKKGTREELREEEEMERGERREKGQERGKRRRRGGRNAQRQCAGTMDEEGCGQSLSSCEKGTNDCISPLRVAAQSWRPHPLCPFLRSPESPLFSHRVITNAALPCTAPARPSFICADHIPHYGSCCCALIPDCPPLLIPSPVHCISAAEPIIAQQRKRIHRTPASIPSCPLPTTALLASSLSPAGDHLLSLSPLPLPLPFSPQSLFPLPPSLCLIG